MALSSWSVEALVQLKGLLNEARRVSRALSAGRRSLAVVLLDAVNERTLYIAALEAGLNVDKNVKFEDMYSKVRAEFPNWKPNHVWRDVSQLHRMRNAVQHSGMSADRDQIPVWLSVTEEFARTLVGSLFDVELDQVVLADAIEDAHLQALMRDAATSDDHSQALRLVFEAFDTVNKRWRAQSKAIRTRYRRPVIVRSTFRDSSEVGQISQAVQQLEELSTAEVFASSRSEHLWFTHLKQATETDLSADEVARAIAFVFWWIVEWEAFSRSFDPNRIAKQQQRLREERTGPGPAEISGAKVLPAREATRRVQATLTNVPEACQAVWEQEFIQGLGSADGIKYPRIVEPLNLVFEVGIDVNMTDVLQAIGDALNRAEVARVQAIEAAAQQARREEEFALQVRQYQGELPDWLDSVRLEVPARGGPEEAVLSYVQPGIASLVYELFKVDPVFKDYRLLHGGETKIVPAPSLSDLMNILERMNVKVKTYLDEANRKSATAQRETERLQVQLDAALRALGLLAGRALDSSRNSESVYARFLTDRSSLRLKWLAWQRRRHSA